MFKKPEVTAFVSLVIGLVVLNVFCLTVNLNADTSFSLRFALPFFDAVPQLILVQPGNRFFPEWIYAALIIPISDNPLVWSRIMIATNTVLLTYAVIYFARTVGLNKKQAWAAATLVLTVIPVMTLLHHNVMVYFIYSTGIHGFYIPFVLLALSLSLKLLNHQARIYHGAIYTAVLALCVGSNLGFSLAVIPSIGVLATWLMWQREIQFAWFFHWAGLTVVGLLLAWLFMSILGQSASLSLLDLPDSYFSVSFSEWLFTDNHFLKQLNNRTVSGWTQEIMLASIASSVLVLFKNSRQNNKNHFNTINILFLVWLPVFLLAMWALGKTNIRLVPFLWLFSPVMLLLNLAYLFRPALLGLHLGFSWVMVFLALFAWYLQPPGKHPYIQHHTVVDSLQYLREQHKINDHGLAGYWLANMPHSESFSISPISANGKPYGFATNVFNAWSWKNNQPVRKVITYIVNHCNHGKVCDLQEPSIEQRFGQWSEKHSEQHGNKTYHFYIYANGINSNSYYENLEQLVIKHKPEVYKKYMSTNN